MPPSERKVTWAIGEDAPLRLAWFTASFDSECDGCLSDMYEGDRIARTPDAEYICENCGTEWEAEHAVD